jgi:hypothetical protein
VCLGMRFARIGTSPHLQLPTDIWDVMSSTIPQGKNHTHIAIQEWQISYGLVGTDVAGQLWSALIHIKEERGLHTPTILDVNSGTASI